jgi:two-component system sensor histidine kinase HydH
MMSDKLAGFEKEVASSSRLAAAGKVTAAMSHEIRNPLSSIKMLAQLLRERLNIGSKDRKIIQAMLEEVMRVERIVGDLSDLQRPSSIDRNPHDIRVLISEILPVIEPKTAHRKVRIDFDVQENLPEILLDKDKIKQVLWNLLLNAMESMPHGGRIMIKSWVDGEQNRLHVSVEDDGCGFDEAHGEDIFTPFFTTIPEGLGLGLSTSREIMTGHGGALVLENRNDRGVRAVMIFPLNE